jgi:hypothetical protein
MLASIRHFAWARGAHPTKITHYFFTASHKQQVGWAAIHCPCNDDLDEIRPATPAMLDLDHTFLAGRLASAGVHLFAWYSNVKRSVVI